VNEVKNFVYITAIFKNNQEGASHVSASFLVLKYFTFSEKYLDLK